MSGLNARDDLRPGLELAVASPQLAWTCESLPKSDAVNSDPHPDAFFILAQPGLPVPGGFIDFDRRRRRLIDLGRCQRPSTTEAGADPAQAQDRHCPGGGFWHRIGLQRIHSSVAAIYLDLIDRQFGCPPVPG